MTNRQTASSFDDVGKAFTQSAAFASLPPASQRDVTDSIATLARQLAPDLSGLRRDGGGSSGGGVPIRSDGSSGARAPGGGAAPASPGTSPGTPATTPAAGAGAASRVGDVTKSTLSAIDFPSFVSSLIQGTFQAIVDASIQQMEAYAELLKNAAITVDQFTKDNVTEGTARDYLADRFDGVFERDTSGSAPRLKVKNGGDSGAQSELPSFFKDLGIDDSSSLDDRTVEDTVVPATKRMLAERRQQTLATMVLMGINRIVVSDGEISAKLQFHVDASETTQMRFDQQKSSGMNMSGTAGRNPFSAQGIMVNTSSLNAQSALNVRADLVGSVVVRFRSETFPLERFADSAAIQLINTRAKVPPPAPAAAAATPAPFAPPASFAPTPPTKAPAPPPALAALPAPAPIAPSAPNAPPAPPAMPTTPQAQSFDDNPWA